MTVRMSIFRKKHDLGREEFQSYWRNVHAPIALQIPALQRYEQNCVVDEYHSGEPAFRQSVDGICKLRFQDETAMQSVSSPEMTRILMEDEAKFLEGLRTFIVRQSHPFPLSEGAVTKCVSLVTRRKDWDIVSFEKRWSDDYAPWVRSLPGVRGYTQNFVTGRTVERRPASYDQSPVDCIDELWFESGPESQTVKDAVEQMQLRASHYTSAINSFTVTVNVPAMQ